VSNHAHPDLIETEKEGSTIKIKASHEMLKEAMTRPYHSTRKVFIVKNAEDMTVEASNALLKVLEEPPPYVTFILTATNPKAIPETIISRCQTVPLRKLSPDVLAEILEKERDTDAKDAAEVAHLADGDLERAIRLLSRRSEGMGADLLSDISQGSLMDLAQKHAKLEAARRVDVLVDLELELVKRLREKTANPDLESAPGRTQGEIRLLYRSMRSVQRAKERLRSNVNPLCTFFVLFMDLSRARQEGE